MTPSTTSFGWAAAGPASTQPLTSATRTDGRVLASNGVMTWPSGAPHSITGARGERRPTSGCRGLPLGPRLPKRLTLAQQRDLRTAVDGVELEQLERVGVLAFRY